MGSIAYIVNNDLIEYHRINVHKEISLLLSKGVNKFSGFKVGDFIFFLGKKKKTNRSKEKGIIAYGKLESIDLKKREVIWDDYQEKLGYYNKKFFEDEIAQIKERNKELQILNLSNVVYLGSPIYLSDLGVVLPGKLSGYTYLSKFKDDITSTILSKVQSVGTDFWNTAISDKDSEQVVELNEVEAVIAKFLSDYKFLKLDYYNRNKMTTAIEKFKIKNPQYKTLNNIKEMLYYYNKANINIVIGLITTKKYDNRYKLVVGYCLLLVQYLKVNHRYPINIQLIGVDEELREYRILEEV